MSYLFSGKIKCIDCGRSYRGKLQREKKVYICMGYEKKTSLCKRMSVKEEDLIDVVRKHFNQEEFNEIDLMKIKMINVTNVNIPKVTIEYTDGTTSLLSPTRYKV